MLSSDYNLNIRFVITDSVRDRPRPGQRHVTSQQNDRYITLTHLRNRLLPATATARQLVVNARTIQNRLRQNNIPIRVRRPYTGPIMTAGHRAARLLRAQRHLHWTRRRWHNVIFSDESQFCISHADGRVHVYQRRNEIYAQCCIRERDGFGAGLGRYHGQRQRVRTNHQINNVHLTQALQLEWYALPIVLIRRYVNSMRRRIRACIVSNGGHTRY